MILQLETLFDKSPHDFKQFLTNIESNDIEVQHHMNTSHYSNYIHSLKVESDMEQFMNEIIKEECRDHLFIVVNPKMKTLMSYCGIKNLQNKR